MSNEQIVELEKKIKDLEHKVKYTKNPMEARQLRSKIGSLQRELVAAKKYNK